MLVQDIFTERFVLIKNINVNHEKILSDLKKADFKIVTSNNYETVRITKDNKLLKNMKTGKLLEKELNKHIEKAIKEAFGFNVKHQIVNSWGTLAKPGVNTKFHYHKNYWLSACYYPHGLPKDKYKIIFQDMRNTHWEINIADYNNFNSPWWHVYIEKGDLIIFPAHLSHAIGTNETDTDRYSIAVNILPKGKIGHSDGELIL
jgi:uncharacterized protein (TIGR02466 family)